MCAVRCAALAALDETRLRSSSISAYNDKRLLNLVHLKYLRRLNRLVSVNSRSLQRWLHGVCRPFKMPHEMRIAEVTNRDFDIYVPHRNFNVSCLAWRCPYCMVLSPQPTCRASFQHRSNSGRVLSDCSVQRRTGVHSSRYGSSGIVIILHTLVHKSPPGCARIIDVDQQCLKSESPHARTGAQPWSGFLVYWPCTRASPLINASHRLAGMKSLMD